MVQLKTKKAESNDPAFNFLHPKRITALCSLILELPDGLPEQHF